jgi:predicted SnoaL-like aldol condensation-catalyzing enzyme
MLDLLECKHWDEADQWLTTEYHPHNPMAGSARKPTPLPTKMNTRILAVLADGDLVTVVTPRNPDDPRNPVQKYYTT